MWVQEQGSGCPACGGKRTPGVWLCHLPVDSPEIGSPGIFLSVTSRGQDLQVWAQHAPLSLPTKPSLQPLTVLRQSPYVALADLELSMS